MLGKLIKYDLKALTPILLIIHAFLLFAALFIRFFLTGHLFREEFDFDDPRISITAALVIILFSLAMTLVLFSTELLIAARYYKNLFSDEGYLTFTLPVTPGQHLLSKTVSGMIWGLLDLCLVFLAAYITFATPYVRECVSREITSFWREFAYTAGLVVPSPGKIILFIILFMFAGVAANLLVFYASIAIGQMIFGHRILGAIAVYFVINTVYSILSIIALAVSGNLTVMFYPSSFNPLKHLRDSLVMTCWLSAVTFVIFYGITWIIMQKKINLD